MMEMSSQTPTVSRRVTAYSTSRPVPMGVWASVLGGVSGGAVVEEVRKQRTEEWRRGVEDQLEVSEWTLPGPSVGEVTDEGVGASCQPPFAWEKNTRTTVGGVSPLLSYSLLNAAGSNTVSDNGWKSWGQGSMLTDTLSYSPHSCTQPWAKLPPGLEEKLT